MVARMQGARDLLLLALITLASQGTPWASPAIPGVAAQGAWEAWQQMGVARVEQEEALRVQDQCSGATWQQEYTELHKTMRQGKMADRKRRFLTFTCTPGLCGGIGDLLIGVVSSFLIAFMQQRALIIDYAWMESAFEPATPEVDWRMRPDVPLIPSRHTPGDEESRRALRQDAILYLNMHNKDLPADVAAYFDSLLSPRNIRLLLNRGILVKLFTGAGAGEKSWRVILEEKGLRLPSAFGCILRFLIKPKPEILDMIAPYMHQVHTGSTPTAAVGVHIRTSDARTWKVEKVGEKPKLKPENVRLEMKGARRLFACAWKLERFFYGPGVQVKWVLFSSSQALKVAALSKYSHKVVITDIAPMHIELKGSDNDRESAFKTTVAEWVLLSKCCSHFVFTESGFSKTAALYSLKPLSTYMFGRWADSWRDASWVDKCIPEEPTPVAVMGNITRWSGI